MQSITPKSSHSVYEKSIQSDKLNSSLEVIAKGALQRQKRLSVKQKTNPKVKRVKPVGVPVASKRVLSPKMKRSMTDPMQPLPNYMIEKIA